MVSSEKKKRFRMHLDNAQRHAQSACRFNESRMAAREMQAAIAGLSQAVEVLAETLDRRPELY